MHSASKKHDEVSAFLDRWQYVFATAVTVPKRLTVFLLWQVRLRVFKARRAARAAARLGRHCAAVLRARQRQQCARAAHRAQVAHQRGQAHLVRNATCAAERSTLPSS